VILMTAFGEVDTAVEAMSAGAFWFVKKPFQNDELLALVARALESQKLWIELRRLRHQAFADEDYLHSTATSMQEAYTIAEQVARGDTTTVLIDGESGTGKEYFANLIHRMSARHDKPFVEINCAAIPRELLESELFGHERGAFTGAIEARAGRFREASGGTLFLDEIGDMPVDLQAKLLRVLQSGEVTSVGGRRAEPVSVRIVAATHRDLDAAVASGGFREDLLYRLRVVPIEVPPLRERREDIPPLIDHFLARYDAELTGGMHVISPAAVEKLARHTWPGNVRELENAIKRALVLAAAEVIGPDDFAFLDGGSGERVALTLEGLVRAETEAALAGGAPGELHAALLARVEKPLIETALAHTGGNQLRAAELLGINRNTLRKRIGELGIDVPDKG
jgi:two-component system nitrogen regulation response regulator GlnG